MPKISDLTNIFLLSDVKIVVISICIRSLLGEFFIYDLPSSRDEMAAVFVRFFKLFSTKSLEYFGI